MHSNYFNETLEKSWTHYKYLIPLVANQTENILKIAKSYSFSVILVDSINIKAINHNYRNIDSVTDVISFAYNDSELTFSNENAELGDIFINTDYIRLQAKEYGHTLKREFAFLVTHGLLHLLGYDHQEEHEERIMINLQKEILNVIKK
ncbi:MAG: rRNA maturation RNase YbeY [Erysipelotrichaceae bacterium]